MANLKNNGASVREAYLADVTERLRSEMSPLELYEYVQEMRTHLECMASAYEELGLEPQMAMEQAIIQFGQPEHVAPVSSKGANLQWSWSENLGFGPGVVASIGSVLGFLLVSINRNWLQFNSYQFVAYYLPNYITGLTVGGLVGLISYRYKNRSTECALFTALVISAFMYAYVFPHDIPIIRREANCYTLTAYGIGSWLISHICAKLSRRMQSERGRLVRS